MSDTSLQIVLIVSKNNKLIGTVTDGDIRRGLLNGINLKDKISKIMKKDPLVVTNQLNKKTAKYIMKANSLLQLPIIDKNKKIVGLHLWNEYQSIYLKKNTVVIMAGGFGKRMMPETKSTPKPMIKLHGKPILEHIIINIRECGFKNIIITTHYLSDVIKNYFGNGKKWGVNINYFKEKMPLGTAGSLSSIKFNSNKPIVVTNGDVMSDINFSEILEYHINHKADATMAVREVEEQNPFGVIESSGIDIKRIIEKPIKKLAVNAGIYVINKKMTNYVKKNEALKMTDFFTNIKKKNKKTILFPIHETWKDIGKPADLKIKKKNK